MLRGFRCFTAHEALDGESSQIAPMLTLIMIAVGLILLVACANVAGLILARSTRRQKELALRQALGAGRSRIARQLLAESMLLSSAGGSLGVLFAVWGVEAITKFVSNGANEPFAYTIAPDWRVLSFTTALTLATGLAVRPRPGVARIARRPHAVPERKCLVEFWRRAASRQTSSPG